MNNQLNNQLSNKELTVFTKIAFCLSIAVAVAGCGVCDRSEAPGSSSTPIGASATSETAEELAFVEPVTDPAEFAKLAAGMNSFTSGDSDVWAFRVHGGTVLIHVAIHCDSQHEHAGERRTVWHSESVWPEASSVEDDSAEQMRYTFSRFPVHVVVQSGSPPSVVVQHPSARRHFGGVLQGEGVRHLPVYFPRSLEEARVLRSFSMTDIKINGEFTAGFRRVLSKGTTRGILNLRTPIKVGETVELYQEWPVANLGPDDSPLVLVVTATRLDLPAEYDESTLRTKIGSLRKAIAAKPADCRSRLELAVCLEMLTQMESVDHGELRRLREEAVDLMRQAVAQQPSNATCRDRLRRELTNRGYAVSLGPHYATIPQLMEEILQLQPGFDNFNEAAILAERCVLAVRSDDTILDVDKKEHQQRYSQLAVDYLRRGLQFELDHGGIELLNQSRRWLAAQGASETTTHSALQIEFETDRSAIETNIGRLSSEREQHPTDGEPCYLLAAAHDMLAIVAAHDRLESMSAGNYLEDAAATRGRHERQAVEFARQATGRDPGNEVYRRRLRRQLLHYADTITWRSADFAVTPQLVQEALQYDPQFLDFIVGANCIWRATLHADTNNEFDEAQKAKSRAALRAAFIATLSDGIDWAREYRAADYQWLVEQLPTAIPGPATEWPEFLDLLEASQPMRTLP